MAQPQIYKIYKITSPQTDKIYIGSTKNTLNKRFTYHKYLLNCSSKLIIEFGDAEIELIEEVDEQNRLFRERHWIEFYTEQCVNKIIPIRTKEEKREHKTEYNREYYEANREQINEHQREYYEANSEQIREYKRAFYEANSEQIREKRNEKITCECGGKTTKANISTHLKTKKHLKFVQSITNQSSLDVE